MNPNQKIGNMNTTTMQTTETPQIGNMNVTASHFFNDVMRDISKRYWRDKLTFCPKSLDAVATILTGLSLAGDAFNRDTLWLHDHSFTKARYGMLLQIAEACGISQRDDHREWFLASVLRHENGVWKTLTLDEAKALILACIERGAEAEAEEMEAGE